MVVAKEKPGDTSSRVLSYECVPGNQLLAPEANSVPILIVYQDINYGGKHVIVYGKDGPCDAAGYHITGGLDVGGISSIQYATACYYQRGWIPMNCCFSDPNCIHFQFNTPWVGSRANDKLWEFRVTSTFHPEC
jgi:hypothetical protein